MTESQVAALDAKLLHVRKTGKGKNKGVTKYEATKRAYAVADTNMSAIYDEIKHFRTRQQPVHLDEQDLPRGLRDALRGSALDTEETQVEAERGRQEVRPVRARCSYICSPHAPRSCLLRFPSAFLCSRNFSRIIDDY